VFGRWRKPSFSAIGRIEVVLAEDAGTDACAVLTMITRFHGRHVEIGFVADILDRVANVTTNEDTTRNARDVVLAAEELGLSARGLQLERAEELSKVVYPCVAHAGEIGGYGRFVLLEGLEGSILSIIDPYSGRRRDALELFFKTASGVVLEFKPGEPLPKATLR
jgi:ABC-type bacteriocin/lantibiotic exporter with double-glycine peptidase domain